MAAITKASSSSSTQLVEVNPIAAPIHAFLEGRQHLSEQTVIAELKKDHRLAQLFSLFAGVGEGYSVEQHSHMVVDSFIKEFADQPEVQDILRRANLTPEQFVLFLALHDIGKGLAVTIFKNQPEGLNPEQFLLFLAQHDIRTELTVLGFHPMSEERKEKELDYTQRAITLLCEELNLQKLNPVFQGLLLDDSIGDLMKTWEPTEADIQTAAESIHTGAATSQLSAEDFLELKILFHKVDAASYDFVRTRFFKHDRTQQVQLGHEMLPKYVGYSDENEGKVKQLKEALFPGTFPIDELVAVPLDPSGCPICSIQ